MQNNQLTKETEMVMSVEIVPADMANIRRIRRSKHLEKELLPGISNDVTLELICPKLSWREFPALSTVSDAWRDAIQSRLVYDARVRSSSTETLVVVLHSKFSSPNLTYTLSIYSMKDKTLNDLPPIPFVSTRFPVGCQCVTVEGKIYILGGLKDFRYSTPPSSDVYVLDLAGKLGQWKWKQCASMRQPRTGFACCAKDGKIYVFGGMYINSAVHESEVYNPKLNCWSPIKPMMSLRVNHQVLAMGEELVVHGGEFLFPAGVDWNDDHPFVDVTESNNDETDGPHIYELKNQATSAVESIEAEDLLIDPIESSGNEAENRLAGDSYDYNEPKWSSKTAKFLEIYNPTKKEWKMLEPSESNGMIKSIFEAQGKFHYMCVDKIYVQDIDADSWKFGHLDSWKFLQLFSSRGPYQDYATLAVDHEIVAIVPRWNHNREYVLEILQSTGFGNENEELDWEITAALPPSSMFPPLVCLIQL